MEKIITRFAPSPTGMLHVGNARTALINWLYARKNNGSFVLRFDDTDPERNKQLYKDEIINDLKFLGLNWDKTFSQSTRIVKYEYIKERLLQKNRLYPCFETHEELEEKRKIQLSKGFPPIYDRYSKFLSKEQIDNYIKDGRKPHYRFLLNHTPIIWQDIIRKEVKYDGKNLSDPIVIREDGSITYMLCSIIDDIDYAITHIIRGEDHITSTAIQIQMFEALEAKIPKFAHLSLVISRDEKISKRVGGFEIASLRNIIGFEAMAINSFFSLLGSSIDILPIKTLNDLIKKFEITKFSRNPIIYQQEELERLNHKLLISLSFDEVKDRLKEIGCDKVNEQFWLAVRPNLQKIQEIKDWWNICYSPSKVDGLDRKFLKQSADLLENELVTVNSWQKWTNKIQELTGKKGKNLFLPLRLAITGTSSGPEMSNILPLIKREEIIRRLVEP